jgi:hypothetical protein
MGAVTCDEIISRMFDLFDLFRWLLGTIVTIYATIVLLQWAWSWWVWLTRPDPGYERHFALLRRYLVIHGLRIRVTRFGVDLLVIIGLCIVFVLLLWAHMIIYDIDDMMRPPRSAKNATSHVTYR